jgi:DNA-binding MarR family transcriptional regulator
MAQLVQYELGRDGVDSSHYAVLSLVGVRNKIRVSEVAAELGMPLTTTSDVVKRLEDRGHLARSRNPADARSVLVELTPAGDTEWRKGWPALQRINLALETALVDPARARGGLEDLGRAFDDVLREVIPNS